MTYEDKQKYLKLCTDSKCGRRDPTWEELEWVAACRKQWPDDCKELDEEVQERAFQSVTGYRKSETTK